MKILDQGSYLTIEFGPPDAQWSILVIDDFWDRLVDFICGVTDITGKRFPGVGEACIDPAVVEEFWKETKPSKEIFERALLLLPWMVHGIEGYNAVTFCGFPNDLDSLQKILSEDTGSVAPRLRQWAFLIDVTQQQGETNIVRFVETWDLLDKAGQPAFSRAMFTRGGADIPTWTDNVYQILKQRPTGGIHAHRRLVRQWLHHVRGAINGAKFQQIVDVAGDYCHKPSELKTAPKDKRKLICEELTKHDPYGVWRWANEAAARDTLPADAAHRWLAAKAFQTWPGGRADVLITGLVALCAGMNFLYEGVEHRHKPHFKLASDLAEVGDEDIDFIHAMGRIELSSGNYESFARALRHWLTLTEQFEEGHARIEAVSIRRPQAGQPLRLEFTFTDRLPDAVFDPRPGVRQGRTTYAWQQLKEFAAGTDAANNPTVALLFDYIPYQQTSP